MGRIRSSDGLVYSGDVTAEWANNPGTYSGGGRWQAGTTPPSIFTHYLVSGIMITTQFAQAKANLDTNVYLFSINGYSFFVSCKYRYSNYEYRVFVLESGNYVQLVRYQDVANNHTILSAAIVFAKSDSDKYCAIGDIYYKESGVDYFSTMLDYTTTTQNALALAFDGLRPITDDPYSTQENETPPGGYGPFDYGSDDVLPPSLPSSSAAQVGFVSLWNPSAQEMKDLADYLWTGTFDLTNFKKLFTDPMQ